MAELTTADVDALLQEITPEEPCGVNLEYDRAFLDLEQAVIGKPEVQYGDTLTPAMPADWKIVKSMSLDLLTRSRDLRIAVPLTRALLKLQGISGFAIGLHFIEKLMEQRWESMHPQLDPLDDLDPMLRVNTLFTLCEADTVLQDIRETPLVASRAHGIFCLRQIDLATGEIEAQDGEEKITLSAIDAAFLDADPEARSATLAALEAALSSINNIESTLTKNVGVGKALDFAPLAKVVKRARDFVHARVGASTEGDTQNEESTEGPRATGGTGAAPLSITGEVNSSDDVARLLGKICAYYARHEPSSPIPLLLLRAQRLVDKSFVEILQDLAPDGLAQVYSVGGIRDEN